MPAPWGLSAIPDVGGTAYLNHCMVLINMGTVYKDSECPCFSSHKVIEIEALPLMRIEEGGGGESRTLINIQPKIKRHSVR